MRTVKLHNILKRTAFTSAIIPPRIVSKPNAPPDEQIVSLLLTIPVGTRQETSKTHGISNLIKNCLFLSNRNDSRIAIAKETELQAANLGAFLDRERIMVYCNVPKRNVQKIFKFLVGIVGNCEYLQNEFEDGKKLAINNWNTYQCCAKRVIQEGLHHVAFRNGLGNSIFTEPHVIDKVDLKQMQEYKTLLLQSLKPDSILAHIDGMQLEEWEQLLNDSKIKERIDLFFPMKTRNEGNGSVEKSKYYGGELRISSAYSEHNYFSFALPVLKPNSLSLPLVLHELLSPVSLIPFYKAENGLFYQSDVECCLDFYTDAALFSIIMNLPKKIRANEQIQSNLDKFYSLLDGKFISKNLENAKKRAIMGIMLKQDDPFERLNLASKLGHPDGTQQSIDSIIRDIQNLNQEGVQNCLKQLLSNKPSVVSLGQLADIPFADELKFNR